MYLLPFVESAALFDRLVLVPPAGLGWDSMTMNYPPNGPVVGSTIAAYPCPADPRRKPVVHGSTPGSRSNYVGCFSPDGTMVERSDWYSRFAFDPARPLVARPRRGPRIALARPVYFRAA